MIVHVRDRRLRRLHPLRGNLDGMWAVWVSGNYRIIFRFNGRNVRDVELNDCR